MFFESRTFEVDISTTSACCFVRNNIFTSVVDCEDIVHWHQFLWLTLSLPVLLILGLKSNFLALVGSQWPKSMRSKSRPWKSISLGLLSKVKLLLKLSRSQQGQMQRIHVLRARTYSCAIKSKPWHTTFDQGAISFVWLWCACRKALQFKDATGYYPK